MCIVSVPGAKGEYIFSIVSKGYFNFPDWGGVWAIVDASSFGCDVNECLAFGECESFRKSSNYILSRTGGSASHIYLLPESCEAKRASIISDLLGGRNFFQESKILSL